MVQQQSNTMGEDRSSTCTEKKNNEVLNSCRHRHSSVISSCSEDAESESTSAGYPSTPDEEREEEFEYGPGIVSKLKTRYLSIALKQNRGTNMRRSCSMENLLDQDRSSTENSVDIRLIVNGIGNNPKRDAAIGNLKRAKSMDTLLLDLRSESPPIKELVNGDNKKEMKIIRRRDGGLNRTVPMICDEELPKPDTVKTYKRMFEPAESRRGSYCRRPPVLRASAKSSALAASKNNGILSTSSAKVNGISNKNKLSAKQPPVAKADTNVNAVNGSNGIVKKNLKDPLKQPYTGGHVIKPLKIVNNLRVKGDVDKELKNIYDFLNKESQFVSKTDINCNGNANHKEDFKNNAQRQTSNHNKESIETVNFKPKIPPNKPTLKPPKPTPKIPVEKVRKDFILKLKSSPMNGLLKTQDSEKIVENNIRQESKTKEEKPSSPGPEDKQIKVTKSPDVTRLKNAFNCKEINNAVIEKINVQNNYCSKPDKPISETKNETVLITNGTRELMESNKTDMLDTPVKLEVKPVKKLVPSPSSNSMVFDFRGKDVVAHVAVVPAPFGCKSLNLKKRPILIDGKESQFGNGVITDEEDEDYVDYSVPPPSGVIFEGENIKIGRGSILSIRNKDLKITFDDDVDNNTFVYPSENSLLDDPERSLSPPANDYPPPTPPKLKTNTVIGTTGPANGLHVYTPSVLRTMDNFEPGMFRPPPAPILPEKEEDNNKVEEEENTEVRIDEDGSEMLKPADPDIISSWSLSAGTSDLLF